MDVTHEEQLLMGERIRNSRLKASITQEYIASEIGISLRFYQMIERGEKRPSLDTLLSLSRLLCTSIDYILLGDISNLLSNPISDLYKRLSPKQKDNAIKILEIYMDTCQDAL